MPSGTRQQVVISLSGGKDAAWTLHVLRQSPDYDVVCLLTTVTEGFERIAMHGIRREVLHAQADAIGLPVIEARLPQRADNATYENVFAKGLSSVRERWPGIRHIAFGDLHLADIKAYRDAQCVRLGWTPMYPLFGSDTRALAGEMLDGGLRAVLCCVDTQQLDAHFVGRNFDTQLLGELPPSVDHCGEHGEFHTCVHAGPMFKHTLELQRGDVVLRDERFAFIDLLLEPSSNPTVS